MKVVSQKYFECFILLIVLNYILDDYDKSYTKLKLAEVTSDIQSDSESQRVRKRRPPRRLSFGDDEVKDSTLPHPPPLKRLQRGKYFHLLWKYWQKHSISRF